MQHPIHITKVKLRKPLKDQSLAGLLIFTSKGPRAVDFFTRMPPSRDHT
jgi:hypothetical protein